VAVSFNGGGNRITQRNQNVTEKEMQNFKTIVETVPQSCQNKSQKQR
jgi:hypothetical protein